MIHIGIIDRLSSSAALASNSCNQMQFINYFAFCKHGLSSIMINSFCDVEYKMPGNSKAIASEVFVLKVIIFYAV